MHLERALGNSCACAMMLTMEYTTCLALAAGSGDLDPCPASSPLLDSRLSVWLWWELAMMRLRVNRIMDSVHSFISSACTVQSTVTLSIHCLHSPVNFHTEYSLSAQSSQHSHWIFTACMVKSIHQSMFTLDIHCQHNPVNTNTGYLMPAQSTFKRVIHSVQSS